MISTECGPVKCSEIILHFAYSIVLAKTFVVQLLTYRCQLTEAKITLFHQDHRLPLILKRMW